MKHFIICFSLCVFTTISFAQNNHSHIKIQDETKGKFVEIYATNSSYTDYEVFLKINATGFRRIAENPVTKIVPANSKVKMAKLIKISKAESNYTYGIIVNEIGHASKKEQESIPFTFNNSKNKSPVTIYVKDYCDLCTKTIKLFKDNGIVHTILNIDKDKKYLRNLHKELIARKKDTVSYVPMLQIDDRLYTKLRTQEMLIEALKKHYNNTSK